MKVSYVTLGDALDIHQWSGLEYYIAKTIEQQGAEMRYVANVDPHPRTLGKRMFYRLIGQRYDPVRSIGFAKKCSEKIRAAMLPDADIIFSPGTVATALLETKKPKVVYNDATFAALTNFYSSDFCSETIREGNYLEQVALDSASFIFYSSDWAAQSAIRDYNINPSKIKVVPFGANLDCHLGFEELKEMVQARPAHTCELLFLGVDWERKGGAFAVRVVAQLNKMGIHSRLHVAGIDHLPLNPLPGFVVNHGFISKKDESGVQKIKDLMSRCHFLLLPTKAEAYGLVFCEASSFGLPSITTNVGGIPTIIRNDANGRMFDLAATEQEYADYIASVFLSPAAYKALAFSAYEEYCSRLNWRTAGKAIGEVLSNL